MNPYLCASQLPASTGNSPPNFWTILKNNQIVTWQQQINELKWKLCHNRECNWGQYIYAIQFWLSFRLASLFPRAACNRKNKWKPSRRCYMPTGFHRDCAVGQLCIQGPSLPTRMKGLEVDIDGSVETSGLTTAQTGSVQRELIYLLDSVWVSHCVSKQVHVGMCVSIEFMEWTSVLAEFCYVLWWFIGALFRLKIMHVVFGFNWQAVTANYLYTIVIYLRPLRIMRNEVYCLIHKLNNYSHINWQNDKWFPIKGLRACSRASSKQYSSNQSYSASISISNPKMFLLVCWNAHALLKRDPVCVIRG